MSTIWIQPSDFALEDQGFKSQVSLRTNAVNARLKYPLYLFFLSKHCQKYQRDVLMDKSKGLCDGRSGVQIPGRGKCSLRTTAVDARVNIHFVYYQQLMRRYITFLTIWPTHVTEFVMHLTRRWEMCLYIPTSILAWDWYFTNTNIYYKTRRILKHFETLVMI